jgi:hypothetical protein
MKIDWIEVKKEMPRLNVEVLLLIPKLEGLKAQILIGKRQIYEIKKKEIYIWAVSPLQDYVYSCLNKDIEDFNPIRKVIFEKYNKINFNYIERINKGIIKSFYELYDLRKPLQFLKNYDNLR